jgi:hypothetical protein
MDVSESQTCPRANKKCSDQNYVTSRLLWENYLYQAYSQVQGKCFPTFEAQRLPVLMVFVTNENTHFTFKFYMTGTNYLTYKSYTLVQDSNQNSRVISKIENHKN